jgi:hypothetical protein
MKKCRRESCLFPAYAQTCAPATLGDGSAAGCPFLEVRHCGLIQCVTIFWRQPAYFNELTGHHVSGLLKIAPEHLADQVTDIMRKPGKKAFETFLARFRLKVTGLANVSISCRTLSGHPGCNG